MTDDPIVAEVRKAREEYAAGFAYDLDAIYRDIKARELSSGRTYVTFDPRGNEGGPGPTTIPDPSRAR